MIAKEVVKSFLPYLNYNQPNADKKDWSELGLVVNAPKEAILAYEKYKEIEKKAEEEGIELIERRYRLKYGT